MCTHFDVHVDKAHAVDEVQSLDHALPAGNKARGVGGGAQPGQRVKIAGHDYRRIQALGVAYGDMGLVQVDLDQLTWYQRNGCGNAPVR